MIKQWAIQSKDKEYATKWDDYSTIFDDLKSAKKGFIDHLSRDKDPYNSHREKKITRLVSFVVLDNSVSIDNRPGKGCTILEVLDYHEAK